jgi:hypothetical protein
VKSANKAKTQSQSSDWPPSPFLENYMASMTTIICACGCGRSKKVRTADVKRGWGKFYSKSCKAKEQEKRTGQNAAYKRKQLQRGRGPDLVELIDRKLRVVDALCTDENYFSDQDLEDIFAFNDPYSLGKE